MAFLPYLMFGGNCREAFTRDEQIFGGELFVMTMAEVPDGESTDGDPDTAEAHRIFEALSEGGQVDQPIIPTFFSPAFGLVVDRFGVPWMVVADQPGEG